MKLIVNADDYGYCPERNRGIRTALETGIVTHTTVLVNAEHAPHAGDAADEELAASTVLFPHCPPQDVAGLHFNITEGHPVSNPALLPSLVVKRSEFRGSSSPSSPPEFVFMGKQALLDACEQGKVNPDEVALEFRSQAARLNTMLLLNVFNMRERTQQGGCSGSGNGEDDKDRCQNEIPNHNKKNPDKTGTDPLRKMCFSHFDGHNHVHVFPIVRDVISSVALSMGLKTTRLPFEFEDLSSLSPFLEKVNRQAAEAKSLFTSCGLVHPDAFLGLGLMGARLTLSSLKQALLRVQSAGARSCELMVHPGFKNKGSGGCGVGPDDFSLSDEREYELTVLTDDEMVLWLKDHEIELVSFSNLQEVVQKEKS